jgi:RimJ/RimL family protein N-acetyltransferase
MVAGAAQSSAVLTDGVITLRPPEEGDLDAIYEACQDPDIQRWTGVPSPYRRAHATGYLERVTAERASGKSLAFLGVDDEGTLLGNFSVMELDHTPGYGEIGYWVAKEARGKGLASRAVLLLRDYAADELGLELIELIIHEGNALSRRVAERTGFLDIGERRIAPRQEGATDHDHMVYAWRAS